jgi:hypothetical protein
MAAMGSRNEIESQGGGAVTVSPLGYLKMMAFQPPPRS